MKWVVVFLSLVCMSVYALMAQPKPMHMHTAEEEAEKQTEMMQDELSLSQAQRDTIYQINLKYAKARRASNTRAEMIERIHQKMAEFKGVLTQEQYNQYMNCQLNDGNNKRCAPIFRRPMLPADSAATPSNISRGLQPM